MTMQQAYELITWAVILIIGLPALWVLYDIFRNRHY